MGRTGKRAVLIGGVVAMVAIVTVAVLSFTSGGSGKPVAAAATKPSTTTPSGPVAATAASAARQYLAALTGGHLDTASLLTDDPAAASSLLNDAVSTLHPTAMRATLGAVGPTSAKYSARWTLDAHHTWSYSGTFGLVRTDSNWRVHWTPGVLYPTLRDGQRLALVTVATDHTAVVDREGNPLVTAGANGRRLVDKDFQSMLTALVSRVPSGPSATFGIERVDASGRNLQTLYGSATGTAKVFKSTVSASVQSAALSVVDSYSGDATIVAMSSDGGLLAAAQNGTDQPSPFVSLYAPGSTFKIVTATAALEAGVATEKTELPCPKTDQIGTRTISNEGVGRGTISMRLAFAHSCNTTFGRLASQVRPAELVDAADQFGLNADFEIPGLDTQTGKVVPSADADQQVEDGIGQGNEQVSPFGEALMAATVAAGHAVTPQLWRDEATSVATAYSAPPDSVLTPLRGMMRAVVTTGTATGLAGSGTVYGKTGTAQVADPTDANGWFTGYRGDIAFTVFLPNSNDSAPAVMLAAKFLAALG